MNTTDIWNHAIALPRPTVREIEALVPGRISSEVFAGDPGLRQLAPNVVFEIAPGAPYDEEAEVINVVVPFVDDYFKALPRALMVRNLASIRWGNLILPCDAEKARHYVREVGGTELQFITESDAGGSVMAWKIRVGAMTFEFEPLSAGSGPADSRLVSVAWNFRIPHSFVLPPSLSEVRPGATPPKQGTV